MDGINPATKQYWIFSGVISLIVSAIYNFGVINILEKTFIYGFPISLAGTEGFQNFIARLLNTIIMGLILTPLTFFFFKWLETRH
jgi:hypothetical protein